MPDSRLHGLQHARLPCPLLSPGVCLNSRLLNWWCYLTISSSAVCFSFCLWPFPASKSFQTSWHFAPGDQSTTRASVFISMCIYQMNSYTRFTESKRCTFRTLVVVKLLSKIIDQFLLHYIRGWLSSSLYQHFEIFSSLKGKEKCITVLLTF